MPERRSGGIRPNLTLTESEAPQSLSGQHGKGVDRLFEMVSFRRRLKVSKVDESLMLRGGPFQTVGAK